MRIQRQRVGDCTLAIQRHIALVGTHHGAENLSRQIEIAVGHASLNEQWRLHQIGELLKQSIGKIGDGFKTLGRCLHLLTDPMGPIRTNHLNTGGRHGLLVVRCRGNHHGVAAQTMASAGVTAAHVRVAAVEMDGDNLITEQGHEPPHRPREAALT